MTNLIVEDGTNIADADCWADETVFDDWCIKFQGAVSPKTVDEKRAAIRRSVSYVQSLEFKGRKTGKRSQTLPFPRSGCTDKDGYSLESNEIPTEVVQAQHHLTWAELETPGVLNPNVNRSQSKVLTEAAGVKWTALSSESGSIDSQRTFVVAANDYLSGLMQSDLEDGSEKENTVFVGSIG